MAIDLVSIREGWFAPPSYIAAYLNDVTRSAAARGVTDPTAGDADITAQVERVAPAVSRQILPRGPGGMVGVGAMLASAYADDDPMISDDDY